MLKPQSPTTIKEKTNDTGLGENYRHQGHPSTAVPSTMSKKNDSLTSNVNRSTLRPVSNKDGGSAKGKLDPRQLDLLSRVYEMVLGWEPQAK